MSAAVVFAGIRMPVGGVLAYARDLLEQEAKDGNGRDSLAVAVLKSAGPHCQWVTTWDRWYPDRPDLGQRAVELVETLAAKLRDQNGGPGFSSSLLHHVCDTLSLLSGQPDWAPGRVGKLPDGLNLEAYIRAEVVDSWERQPAATEAARVPGREGDHADQAAIADVTRLVTDVLPPSVNRSGTGPTVDMKRVGVDGLLLARFVAGGGHEEEHG